jgi:hypothetical protein
MGICLVILTGCGARVGVCSFRALVDVGVSDIITLLGWAATYVPATQ